MFNYNFLILDDLIRIKYSLLNLMLLQKKNSITFKFIKQKLN